MTFWITRKNNFQNISSQIGVFKYYHLFYSSTVGFAVFAKYNIQKFVSLLSQLRLLWMDYLSSLYKSLQHDHLN